MKILLEITEKEFRQLADYIKINYGINLKEEKKTLIVSRLYKVLQEKNFKSFSDYYQYILSDQSGKAGMELIDRVSTNHTFFMREANHFDYFRDYVLPFLAKTNREKDLRIWSAGCSTGEEPVTLAIIIDDFFGAEKRWWDTKILATDISSKALEIARKGIYENKSLAKLPLNWQRRYFKKGDAHTSVLVDELKKEIIYRKFNLMEKTFSFKRKFQVIFCRNVMIYFDDLTKIELVRKLYEATDSGGYLFIGHTEALNRQTTKYRYIMPAVYRKE